MLLNKDKELQKVINSSIRNILATLSKEDAVKLILEADRVEVDTEYQRVATRQLGIDVSRYLFTIESRDMWLRLATGFADGGNNDQEN